MRKDMTAQEVSKKYNIPMKILEEYRNLGLCTAVQTVMDDWRFDDEDLERLSLIMTLHDIGFSTEEVESYMNLSLKGEENETQLLKLLNEKRTKALDEIHFREKQLDRMDYLRYEIKKNRA